MSDPKCEVPGNTRQLRVSGATFKKPVGKGYIYEDGTLAKQTLPRPEEGTAFLRSYDTFVQYWAQRQKLQPNTMLFSGTFEDTDDGKPLVYKNKVNGATVAASNDYLRFREGSTVARVDEDVKSPDEVVRLHPEHPPVFTSHEEAVVALRSIAPWLQDVAFGVCDSSSSNIVAPDGTPLSGLGGLRLEFPVSDGREIPRVLETLYDLCRVHGFGWGFVDKGGRVHERSLVDLALARPHQPDYAAPATKGCESQRRFSYFEGDVLDVSTVPALTEDEEIRADAARDAMHEALEPHRRSARAQVKERVLAATSDQQTAKYLLEDTAHGDLGITFDGGKTVTVNDLLDDGSAFDEKLCLDPIEPDYDGGRAVGKFYWNDGKEPKINSFAHGGRVFRMRYSAAHLKTWFDAQSDTIASTEEVTRKLALLKASGPDEVLLLGVAAKSCGLGRQTRALRDAVAEYRQEIHFDKSNDDVGAAPRRKRHRIKSIREPLERGALMPGEDMRPVRHIENYRTLINDYGFSIKYNQITKKITWSHKTGQLKQEGDNADEALFAHLASACAVNELSDALLGSCITAIAEENAFNPVVEFLQSLRWDGKPRIEAFGKTCGATEPEVASVGWRIYFLSAVAAADGGEIGCDLNPNARPVYEYVPALVGSQGGNKTKGIQQTIPLQLREYFKESALLAVGNRDSEMELVRHWICELGELDATFNKSDQAHLKGFLSRQYDKMRMPYARTWSSFQRRTIFIATVNDERFLRDQTGNRRFIPIAIEQLHVPGSAEVEQLWAEAWHRYSSGEAWWPTPEEEAIIKGAAEQHREELVFEELLVKYYDWDKPPASQDRHLATSVVELLKPYGRDVSQADLRSVNSSLKKLWEKHGAEVRDGVQKVKVVSGEWVKTNSTGGKNRGWLLPPNLKGIGFQNLSLEEEI